MIIIKLVSKLLGKSKSRKYFSNPLFNMLSLRK